MKPDDSFFQYPSFLPNDIEGFIFYYHKKFPGIISYYQTQAKKFFTDPKGFERFAQDSYEDLSKGFNKIKRDYDKLENKDLNSLIDIDTRLHKLYAFRFWVINYLFADGPLHEYYVDRINEYGQRLVEREHDIEDYESRVKELQRDLLQSDYADLYLENSLNGVKLMTLLRSDKRLSSLLEEIINLLKENSESNEILYKKFDPIIDDAYEGKDSFGRQLSSILEIPMLQADFRKTRIPIYHMIVHSIEFEDENKELKIRHDLMKGKIDSILQLAKDKLTSEEFEELSNSYYMARNLAMSKDVMGNIDSELLPFWFDLLKDIGSMIDGYEPTFIGPGGIFYELVWFLPDEYKAKVFSQDTTPFSLESL